MTSSFDAAGPSFDEPYLTPTYYLRSSVFGGKIIEELNGSGQKIAGYVYHTGGRLLAVQTSGNVVWKHVNPVGSGKYDGYSSTSFVTRMELDPTGADIGLSGPPPPDTGGGDGDVGSNHFGGLMSALTSDLFNPAAGCLVNGFTTPCGVAMADVNFGTGLRGSIISNASVTMNDIAASIGVVFAGASVSKITLNVSGIEGTPGNETMENAWTYAGTEWTGGQNGGWWYGPTSTSYSGIPAMAGSVVSLGTSINFRAVQPQDSEPLIRVLPGFDSGREKTMLETLNNLRQSIKCAKAFASAGLNTIEGLVANGIVIGPATLLNDSYNNQQAGITERARHDNVWIVGRTDVQAVTIQNWPGYTNNTLDTRSRVFLNGSAFNGGTYSLREVLVHELLHVAGWPASGWFRSKFHRTDLSHYGDFYSGASAGHLQ